MFSEMAQDLQERVVRSRSWASREARGSNRSFIFCDEMEPRMEMLLQVDQPDRQSTIPSKPTVLEAYRPAQA